MHYLFWTILIVLIISQAIAYALWRLAFKSPNKTQNDDHNIGDSDQIKPISQRIHQLIDKLNDIPYEVVEITSFDGIKLHGRLYFQSESAPFVICCHGYRGTPSRDFSAGFFNMQDFGMNILLIEQRAHKSSKGKSITMGVKERVDCLDWIQYISSRYGENKEIVLCGVSMGAATVLMTAGAGIPSNVKGVIADSPYTSPKEIVLLILKKMKLPPKMSYFFLKIGSWLYGDFNLDDPMADVKGAVKNIGLPVLLIHGDSDHFVPCEMSKRINEANPSMIEFHMFEKAGHGLSCVIHPEEYRDITLAYLKRILSLSDEISAPQTAGE